MHGEEAVHKAPEHDPLLIEFVTDSNNIDNANDQRPRVGDA